MDRLLSLLLSVSRRVRGGMLVLTQGRQISNWGPRTGEQCRLFDRRHKLRCCRQCGDAESQTQMPRLDGDGRLPTGVFYSHEYKFGFLSLLLTVSQE
jgi:hypothetical protein